MKYIINYWDTINNLIYDCAFAELGYSFYSASA